MAGGGRDHRESAVFGRQEDCVPSWAMRMWTICSSCMMAACRTKRPGDAIGSSEHGHRSQPEKRSERACWRPSPSAAARTAKFWKASRRPATSSGRGATGLGFWTVRRCESQWWGLTTEPRQTRELDGQATGKINADLTAALDLTVAQRLPENAGLSFHGRYERRRIRHRVLKSQPNDAGCTIQPKRSAQLRRHPALGQRSGYHRHSRATNGSSISASNMSEADARCTRCRSSMCESM